MQLNPVLNKLAFFTNEELKAELERRRKPKTITINGIEVPEPLRNELKLGDRYFMPNLDFAGVTDGVWDNVDNDYERLKSGIVHLTKEAAIKHAEALISFTKQP
jgi:hypothetical protein